MSSSNTPNSLEETYPSIDLAYDIAVESYKTGVERLDSIDARIQTLTVFTVSVIAVVVSATAGRLSFRSCWFYAAVLLLLLSIAASLYARWTGDIWLLKPSEFHDKWLHKSPAQFKTDLIYWSGCDFLDNMKLVEDKWRLSLFAIILFALAVACLTVWVAAGHHA